MVGNSNLFARLELVALSASSGAEKIKAYRPFGYLNPKGAQIGQNDERYTTKLSIDIKLHSWVFIRKMGTRLFYERY